MINKFSPIVNVLFVLFIAVSFGFGAPPSVPKANSFCTKCNRNFCTPKPVPPVPGFPGSFNSTVN